jgi:hypothetical protein
MSARSPRNVIVVISALSVYRDRLLNKGTLFVDDNGLLRFTVPGMAAYVLRQAGAEKPSIGELVDVSFPPEGLSTPRPSPSPGPTPYPSAASTSGCSWSPRNFYRSRSRCYPRPTSRSGPGWSQCRGPGPDGPTSSAPPSGSGG